MLKEKVSIDITELVSGNQGDKTADLEEGLSEERLFPNQVLLQVNNERHRARELALKLQRERDILQVLMENTDAHLAYLDKDFNFIYVNSSYAQGCGYSKRELIGRNHFEIFPYKENQQIFEQARDSGQVVEYREKPFEYVNQPEKGVTYWNWRLTPIKNQAGQVTSHVLSLTDVTEIKRAQKFSEILNRINSTINSSLHFDVIMDQVLSLAAEALESNIAGIALRRKDSWEIKYPLASSKGYDGIVLSNEQAPICQWCAQSARPVVVSDFPGDSRFAGTWLLKQGVEATIAVPLITREEVVGILSFSYKQPKDFTSGEVDFACKVGAAISLALENARLNETKSCLLQDMEGILETVAEGILMVENNDIITYINTSAESILGLNRDVILGQSYKKLAAAVKLSSELARDQLQEKINPMSPGSSEKIWFRAERPDGKTIFLSANIAPLNHRNESSKGGLVVSFADITERRRMEYKLKKHSQLLEKVVQKRTSELKHTNELLRLFANKATRKDYLQSVNKLLQQWTQCENVGIRILDEEGRLPYEARLGFSEELCEAVGVSVLELENCACISILKQRPLSQNRGCMTSGGSFLCSNTQEFIQGLSGEEKLNLSESCPNHRWAIMAVIPIRYQEKVYGVIRLADDSSGAITKKLIKFIEKLTPLIGEAIHKFDLEEEVRKNFDTQVVINSLLNLPLEELKLDELVEKSFNIINSVPWITMTRLANLMEKPREAKMLTSIGETVSEIIKRKQAEDELRTSEEMFSKFFNASPIPMSIITLEGGRYIDVNNKFLGVTHRQREEVIGRTVADLDYWLKEEDYYRVAQLTQASGSVDNLEVSYSRKTGDQRTGLLSAELIDIGGEHCILTIINDITERLAMEKNMARLERLNLVGEMAAGIGHEIRNPMTTARGFLQLLGSKEECKKYNHYFTLIIEELDRANEIITEFLSMAKNRTVDLQHRSLNMVVKAISSLIKADAILVGKDVSMKLKEVPSLLLDEKEIRQLILNLARNGLEAMDEGGMLTIRTFVEEEVVVLAVEDQGKGIDPNIVNRLGTPFLTTKDNGTGLGLAICYSIAARHNADLDIKTGPWGTGVYVRFGQRGPLG